MKRQPVMDIDRGVIKTAWLWTCDGCGHSEISPSRDEAPSFIVDEVGNTLCDDCDLGE